MLTKKKLILYKCIAFAIITSVAFTIIVYFPNIPPFLRTLRNKMFIDISDETHPIDKRFLKWFNRDPEREIPNEPNIIVSPADGVVERILTKNGMKHVVIEMRYTDVHVQRVPISGKLISINGGGGKLVEGFDVLDYELDKMLPFQKITIFETEIGIVRVRQITSFFATRIKVYLKIGEIYKTGERLGFVLAGSTVVVEVPGCVDIVIKRNSEVLGGETIIGRY